VSSEVLSVIGPDVANLLTSREVDLIRYMILTNTFHGTFDLSQSIGRVPTEAVGTPRGP
jgi:hypothetical protein